VLFIVNFPEYLGGLTPHPEQEKGRIEGKGDFFDQTGRNILDFSFNLAGFIEMKGDFNAIDPVFTPHFFRKDDPVALNHVFLRFFVSILDEGEAAGLYNSPIFP
jgi:hypothetical protein